MDDLNEGKKEVTRAECLPDAERLLGLREKDTSRLVVMRKDWLRIGATDNVVHRGIASLSLWEVNVVLLERSAELERYGIDPADIANEVALMEEIHGVTLDGPETDQAN